MSLKLQNSLFLEICPKYHRFGLGMDYGRFKPLRKFVTKIGGEIKILHE